jgi:predicted MPP superfamily phosphohydrolase
MKISRRRLLITAATTTLACVGTPLAAYGYGRGLEAEWISVERIKVPVKGLPTALEGFRIVQMSDFHIFPFTTPQFAQKCVDAANALNPDAVVLTGDYVMDTEDSIFDLAPVLQTIKAKHGAFAILGNHDYWKVTKVVLAGLALGGVRILVNDAAIISVGSANLLLAGLDDHWGGRPDIGKTMTTWQEGMTSILLVHEPDVARIYSGDGRFALQLSGHSHGGQIRIPFYGPLWLPPYAQQFDMGLYRVNDMHLYVNRGIGCIKEPVRLNCRPEITEITLTS